MSGAEFSREIQIETLGTAPRPMSIEADEAERAALCRRFGLVALDSLAADLSLWRDSEGAAIDGRLKAKVTQACVATGTPVEALIEESFAVLFRPLPGEDRADDEIELGHDDLDVMFIDGGAIDVGEAAAQSLALALDPFPRAPDAEASLEQAGVKREGEAEAGPFAALAALKAKRP